MPPRASDADAHNATVSVGRAAPLYLPLSVVLLQAATARIRTAAWLKTPAHAAVEPRLPFYRVRRVAPATPPDVARRARQFFLAFTPICRQRHAVTTPRSVKRHNARWHSMLEKQRLRDMEKQAKRCCVHLSDCPRWNRAQP